MASENLYWKNSALRRSLGALLLCFTTLAGAQEPTGNEPAAAMEDSAPSLLDQTFDFDIPAQKVSTAILDIARQAQVQALMTGNVLDNYQTEGLHQRLPLAAALELVLSGTPYTYRQTGSNAIMVGLPDALAVVPDDPKATAVLAQESAGTAADAEAMHSTTASVETARRGGIEEIIVTGQKREERIQDVPIAISAFTMQDLDAQKLEGGFDLLKAIPNVTFSKTNFSGYNFQIRGIGTQAISATTDPGVAVSFNNTTLIVNRLFEQEYLDMERVEVLRGPQGTLYGRNATAGVINVISAKPKLGIEEGEFKLETGNFSSQRLRGHYNFPIGDTLALRAAYASTQREGYGVNLAASDPDAITNARADVDGRDLWTGRLTLGWQPTDAFRANLLWERFEEDDNRVRTSKQLCHRDPGPAQVGDFDTAAYKDFPYDLAQLSQGCLPGSLYEDGAFGTPNGASLPYVQGFYQGTAFSQLFNNGFGLGGNPYLAGGASAPFFDPADAPCRNIMEIKPGFGNRGVFPVDVCRPDPYGGQTQSYNLREIYSLLEPQYRASADVFELSWDLDLSSALVFSSQTVYAKDEYYATQDYNRFTTYPIWTDSTSACGMAGSIPNCSGIPPLFPAAPPGNRDNAYENGFYYDLSPRPEGTPYGTPGVVCDPQLGCSSSLVVQDLSQATSKQFNQEVRLASSFDGVFNFSLGANFTRFETLNNYYVFSNAFTHLLNFFPFMGHNSFCNNQGIGCIYIDPNPLASINGEGHNYFRSSNPYKLTSTAIFGEGYWQLTDALKLTAGLRLTWDQKKFTPIPSQLLLADYRGYPSTGYDEGAPPTLDGCSAECGLLGNAPGGRGAPANPDIVQEWREPTGRIVLDWKPDLPFTDETLLYASLSRGYKGGGANPPTVAPPAGEFFARNSGGAAPPTFAAEYVNAIEIGAKNTLFGGGVILNASAFYYDYTDYQVSKIVDRTAVNENFDTSIWGLELESVIAPTPDLLFNVVLGYLNTKVGKGEKSIDLMDRTDGGNRYFEFSDGAAVRLPNKNYDPATDPPEAQFITYTGFDEWIVVKPWVTAASNCIAPVPVMEYLVENFAGFNIAAVCPAGGPSGLTHVNGDLTSGTIRYDPALHAPNNSAGFSKDLSGNRLPNAPRFTAALGGQYTWYLPAQIDLTTRVDFYWQDESYARIYNTEYDRLKAWTNTNLSIWANKADWNLKVELYVKNLFDETPITGTFLNSDDTGLTTNVFTLDPRLVGLSITKRF
jgi:iron complex outermembrane receptor protein